MLLADCCSWPAALGASALSEASDSLAIVHDHGGVSGATDSSLWSLMVPVVLCCLGRRTGLRRIVGPGLVSQHSSSMLVISQLVTFQNLWVFVRRVFVCMLVLGR